MVDGGSTDHTAALAKANGARVIFCKKGRAKQMNLGAQRATGTILYFLHADTLPPKHYDRHILTASKEGSQAGCFRLQFDSKSRFLSFFAWLSKLNFKICRGGDQSLYITKNLFNSTQKFDERYIIYEDLEFISRLYKLTKFKVLRQAVTTSSRKYQQKGAIRLQYHFAMIHLKNYLGASPEELHAYYLRHIG